MRIISGKYRGRRLVAPDGKDVRPTVDRVKESLFNILQRDVPDARVLDLFAGSGSLGIEALSRGAKEVIFVDASPVSIKTVKANIPPDASGYAVLNKDFRAAADSFDQPFDIVFLDPPYSSGLAEEAILLLNSKSLIGDGIICYEHLADYNYEPPDGLVAFDRRKYGTVAITFIRKGNN